jgi:hypothetical protein
MAGWRHWGGTSVSSATGDVTTPSGCIRWHCLHLHGQDDLNPEGPDECGILMQLEPPGVLPGETSTYPTLSAAQDKRETEKMKRKA